MRAAVLLCAALASCGRVAFDPLNDGGMDARVCTGPFGAPMLIMSLNSNMTEATFRLTADELTGVFWSARTGNIDLYLATRKALDRPFTVAPITSVNDVASEFGPALAPDGSVLVFSSNRTGGTGGLDLYESAFVGNEFAAPTRITSLATAGVEDQAYLVGSEMYFMSGRSGIPELYHAARSGPASYGVAVELTELSSGAGENDPVLSPDALRIYWQSKRSNGGDVYTATRTSTAEPFGSITEVAELTTSSVDAPSFLSTDGCRLYMSSDRAGMPQIYMTSR